MKKLIVNADDFGLHSSINRGIIKGHEEGFITSTSIMPSALAYEEAVELAKAHPKLGIGIHLTLVGGVPSVLPKEKVSSLLDAQGLFVPDYVAFAKNYYTGRVKQQELEAELRAQIERALAAGINITHIDSHQHTHVLPGINSLVTRLAKEYNIRAMRIPKEPYFFKGGFPTGIGRLIGRSGLSFCADMARWNADSKKIKHPDCFFGMLAGGNLSPVLVRNIIEALPEGVSEIMTHPGLDADILGGIYTWGYHWEQELSSYLDEQNKQLLAAKNIETINFGDL